MPLNPLSGIAFLRSGEMDWWVRVLQLFQGTQVWLPVPVSGSSHLTTIRISGLGLPHLLLASQGTCIT